MRTVGAVLKTMVLVTAPAIISIWLSYRLYQMGMQQHSMAAWVILFLASPFTILFTLLAVVFNGLSLIAGLLLIMGRRSGRFRVFTNMGDLNDVFQRPPPRDVTPRNLQVLREPDSNP